MAIAITLCFWLVYHLTASWSFSSDGLCYMLDVEFGGLRNLLHPFHMLYSFLGRGLYMVALHGGYQGRAIFIMQAFNAFVGASALGIFYRTARSRDELWPSTIATLALGFSFAFWSEIVDPGCYALAALATCALLALLLTDPKKSPLQTGIAHGLAVLIHFMLILTLPAFMWTLSKGVGGSRKSTGRYLMGILSVVGLAYGGMALYLGSFREFLMWFLDPAWKPQTQFLSQNYLHWNPIQNLAFTWTAFRDSLVLIAPSWPFWGTLVSSAIVAIVLLAVIFGSVWLCRQKNHADPIAALWIWILGLSSLQFFYASDTRFRVLWLPAFFLLALDAGRAPFLRRPWKWIGGLLPLLVWANFQGTIRPRSHVERNTSFLRAIWVNRQLTSNNFLLFRGGEPQSIKNFYAAYFAHDVPARSLQGFYFIHAHDGLQPLDDLLKEQEKAGRHLVFEESFWNLGEQQRISTITQVPITDVARWLAQWHPVARIVAPDGYALVEVARQAR